MGKLTLMLFVFTILFDQFTRYLFFKSMFRKLIKFPLIFLHSEYKKNFQRKNDFGKVRVIISF